MGTADASALVDATLLLIFASWIAATLLSCLMAFVVLIGIVDGAVTLLTLATRSLYHSLKRKLP